MAQTPRLDQYLNEPDTATRKASIEKKKARVSSPGKRKNATPKPQRATGKSRLAQAQTLTKVGS